MLLVAIVAIVALLPQRADAFSMAPEVTRKLISRPSLVVASVAASPEKLAARSSDMPDNELGISLLCASVMAQAIQPNGTLGAIDQKYIDGAGFLNGQQTVIQGGISNNDACLVGTTKDGVVVAFRGTVTRKDTGYSDWVSDALLYLAAVKNFPGRVHTGFYSAVANIWSENLLFRSSKILWGWQVARGWSRGGTQRPKVYIPDEVKKQLKASGDNTKLYVTGHSKGAGMCAIAATLFSNDKTLPTPEKVLAFAQPNPGNTEFAAGYEKLLTNRHFTFENYGDVVTLVPHALFSYLSEESEDKRVSR